MLRFVIGTLLSFALVACGMGQVVGMYADRAQSLESASADAGTDAGQEDAYPRDPREEGEQE